MNGTVHLDYPGIMLDGGDGCVLKKSPSNVFAIQRPTYTQHEFDIAHGGKLQDLSWTARFRSRMVSCRRKYCTKVRLRSYFAGKLPFIRIMKTYKWRQWLLADFIAGLIVGIMHIPQSMAYAMLAGLRPMYGLYVSFFPSIIYFFFGSSRHISIGTIAIISLLTGQFLERSIVDFPIKVNDSYFNLSKSDIEEPIKAERVAGFCLIVGVIQFLMGMFQLGYLTRYLSDPLISGFTVGASVHVLTSQIKFCFGLNFKNKPGNFYVIKTFYNIFKNIAKTNIPTLIMTLLCIALLFVNKEVVSPRIVNKIKAPLPMELIVVIAGTAASYYLKLNENHSVFIVGKIDQGLPRPALPDLNNISNFIGDGIITAVIAFSVCISLAKIFAKKHGYQTNANQELLAYGIMNFGASFFLCYPAAASLSRSAVQESVGGKTQLTSIISSILLLFVLLFIGPLFETLPKCILSSIIIVALKGMFMQFAELKELWHFSIWDFGTWIITFSITAFISVEMGLILGVALSVSTVMFRTQSPSSHILGQIDGTDIYKNIDVYAKLLPDSDVCQEIDGIKIFRYEGSLYYASSEHFRKTLYTKVQCNPRKTKYYILKYENKLRKLLSSLKTCDNSGDIETSLLESKDILQAQLNKWKNINVHHIIIDCSTWGYIDYVGVKTLYQVIEEYKDIDVKVLLANPKTGIREMFARSSFYHLIDDEIIYVSVHDAVINSKFEHKIDEINIETTK